MKSLLRLAAGFTVWASCVGAGALAQGPLQAWITGGVGLEERSQFQLHRNEFNLRLVFAVKKTGHYLANVETAIDDDQGGRLLYVRSDGPYVFAKLAPGRYVVSATFRAETQRRQITIDENGSAVLHLYWDDPASQEGRSRRPEGFYRY